MKINSELNWAKNAKRACSLLIACAATLLYCGFATTAYAATVTTDQADYAPGSTAVITGSGFLAGETVVLQVLHIGGTGDNDISPAHDPWAVTADNDGAFSATWTVPSDEDELGATLELTAMGQSSGLIAQTTFTDGLSTRIQTSSMSPGTGACGTTITVSAKLEAKLTASTDPFSPLPGRTVMFTLGSSTGSGVTAANGIATASLVVPAGAASLVASFAGDGTYNATVPASSIPFTVTGSCCTAPSFNVCPSPTTVNNDAGVCTAVVTYTATASGSPAPTLSYVLSGATAGNGSGTGSGSTFNKGVTTVTITAMNSCGTPSCFFTVTVNDTEKPTITCPADVVVSTDIGVCTASGVALGSPTTGDNCGVASVGNNAPASYPKGETIVTWTVTDTSGNMATCNQKVTVNDTEKPTITCPADVVVSTDIGVCTASGVVLGSPTTGDNCGVASVGNNAPASYPKGETIVTWTVTDTSGNMATCNQKVTVNDTEKPTITCPADVVVSTDIGVCTASGVVLGSPTTGDNCGVASVGNNAPASYPKGETIVTWTVTDTSGNMATCNQKVTVNDTEKPTITCPADVVVSTDIGVCTASGVVLGSPTTGDNCGVASVGNNAPASYPKGETIVTWTVTDTSGNMATCNQKVTVNDTEKPTITCPADVVVSTDIGVCTASGVVLGSPTTGDNCGVASVGNNAPASYPKGETIVTWTVTDTSGNMATCNQKVTVNDTEKPTITCPADVVVSTDIGVCTASGVVLGSPTTGDNCGVASVGNNAPASYPKGETIVTWTVTDTSGNMATCNQKVTVNDTEKPAVTCPAGTSAHVGTGCTAPVPNVLSGVTASDNCTAAGSLIKSQSPAAGTPVGLGMTTITVTVTDAAGNSSTCSTSFTVVNEPPMITSVTGPTGPLVKGSSATVTVNFTDAETQGHTAKFSWDDGSPDTTVTAGASSASASHTYPNPGVYSVCVTVTDDCAASVGPVCVFVVIYDPNGGFVTGGGWINSPAGAYKANLNLSGKANFGFVSKYLKGATIPTGETEFQFQVGNLDFHSTVYEWLVVAGAKGQYKGSGTINGAGNYGFLLTVTDGQVNGGGGVDKFRIKIDGGAIYDNGSGTDDINASVEQTIAGGSIVIHK